jgi:hypothetical protein
MHEFAEWMLYIHINIYAHKITHIKTRIHKIHEFAEWMLYIHINMHTLKITYIKTRIHKIHEFAYIKYMNLQNGCA